MKREMLKSIASLLAFFIAWGVFGDWLGAIVLTAVIMVHEWAHWWAVRGLGLVAGPPTFIPLLGAFVKIPDGTSRLDECLVAAAGPASGVVLGGIMWLVYVLYPNSLIALVIYGFLMLNFIQLFPFGPFDGGRILQASYTAKTGRRSTIRVGSIVLFLTCVPPLETSPSLFSVLGIDGTVFGTIVNILGFVFLALLLIGWLASRLSPNDQPDRNHSASVRDMRPHEGRGMVVVMYVLLLTTLASMLYAFGPTINRVLVFL